MRTDDIVAIQSKEVWVVSVNHEAILYFQKVGTKAGLQVARYWRKRGRGGEGRRKCRNHDG